VKLKVKVPEQGMITVGGIHLAIARRTVSKAGTYQMTAKLTAAARKSLRRHSRLTIKVRVSFSPTAGDAASKTVSLTVKGQG
jgi:VCBS repeat-containing protein